MLAEGDDVRIIAGGQTLVPLMAMRLARPRLLVDIARIPDLAYIRREGDFVAIGATTKQRLLGQDSLVRADLPLLAKVVPFIGHAPTRARGTVGGSLANADPAAEIALVAVTLGATLTYRDGNATADIPASEFFLGFLETALAPDELLCEIRVPKSGPDGFAFEKFNRRAQDFATVGVVAARSNGTTRVGLINMGSTPLRAAAVEQALAQGADAADAATHAADGTDPSADLNASVEFREHLARVLTRRALEAI